MPVPATTPSTPIPGWLERAGKEPRWLNIARGYLGLREVPGPQSNPEIVSWWKLIRMPFTDDATPWCAGFVGGMLEMARVKSSRAGNARSYLKWGVPLERPAVGCVVVFERGPVLGHVAFVVGKDAAGRLVCIGGNQGDAVSVAAFPLNRVLPFGYRWPQGWPLPAAESLPVVTAAGVSSNEA